MPASTRVATKALAGQEDLLFGEGVANQTRAGQSLPISKIRGFYPVNDVAELADLDFLRFPKAVVVQSGQMQFYQHNGAEYEQVQLTPKGDVTESPVTSTSAVGIETLVIDSATPHTLSNLTNGFLYQRVYIVAVTGNTTVDNNSVIKLKGGVPLLLPSGTGITLIHTGSFWSEV